MILKNKISRFYAREFVFTEQDFVLGQVYVDALDTILVAIQRWWSKLSDVDMIKLGIWSYNGNIVEMCKHDIIKELKLILEEIKDKVGEWKLFIHEGGIEKHEEDHEKEPELIVNNLYNFEEYKKVFKYRGKELFRSRREILECFDGELVTYSNKETHGLSHVFSRNIQYLLTGTISVLKFDNNKDVIVLNYEDLMETTKSRNHEDLINKAILYGTGFNYGKRGFTFKHMCQEVNKSEVKECLDSQGKKYEEFVKEYFPAF